VEEAVLLSEIVARRDFDVDLTRLDAQQPSADGPSERAVLVRSRRFLSTRAADRLRAEVHHQSANPRTVQVPRTQNSLAPNARAT
jgi:hypothetical protein